MVNRIVGRSPGSVTCRNCCQGVGPAQRGGLVEVLADRLHAREVDQRVVARPAPDDDRGDGDLRRPAAVAPVDGVDPGHPEQPVDQARVPAEQLGEHERGRGHRRRVRHEHCDAEERAAAHPVVEQVREAEREQELRHGGEHADRERLEQGVVEGRVGEEPGVVVEADERHRGAEPVAVQADPRGVDQREQPERGEQQEERGDVRVRGRAGLERVEKARTGEARRLLTTAGSGRESVRVTRSADLLAGRLLRGVPGVGQAARRWPRRTAAPWSSALLEHAVVGAEDLHRRGLRRPRSRSCRSARPRSTGRSSPRPGRCRRWSTGSCRPS